MKEYFLQYKYNNVGEWLASGSPVDKETAMNFLESGIEMGKVRRACKLVPMRLVKLLDLVEA